MGIAAHRIGEAEKLYSNAQLHQELGALADCFREEQVQSNANMGQAGVYNVRSWAQLTSIIGGMAIIVFAQDKNNLSTAINLLTNAVNNGVDNLTQNQLTQLKQVGDVAERLVNQYTQQKTRASQNSDELRALIRHALEALAQAFKNR